MWPFSKKYKCSKCGKVIEIRNKEKSHPFFCTYCKYPLYWNADTKFVEVDTLRSKNAHTQWRKATTCPRCKCIIKIDHKNKPQMFHCKKCGAFLQWNTNTNEIEFAKTISKTIEEKPKRSFFNILFG